VVGSKKDESALKKELGEKKSLALQIKDFRWGKNRCRQRGDWVRKDHKVKSEQKIGRKHTYK